MKKRSADVLIIGAGAAGLFAALTLAETRRRVTILSPVPLGSGCASALSQGGIAAAVEQSDSTSSHATDTMTAAAGIADMQVVEVLTQAAPEYVRMLESLGVQFDRDETGGFKLSREACHTHRRVLKAKAGDGFGAELMRALVAAVLQRPEIEVVTDATAERLLTQGRHVVGVQTTDTVWTASAVLLATGGIGGLYAATTNPLNSVGRGIALAARAGALLSDLEFVQFHPTALDIGEDPAPLATEALRGEGAHLVNSQGKRFVDELSPRDVVSRAIFAEIKRGQKVYLDCRHIDVSHFPAFISAARRGGLNAQRDLIPVQPAVHYHMGGIATDINGRTTLEGLWAAGEVAATGLHGANRLASNSLMEAIIMGARAAMDIAVQKVVLFDLLEVKIVPREHDMVQARYELRQMMSADVGVVRHHTDLQSALREFLSLEEVASVYDAKTADMALVAAMIAAAALLRTESRGGHARSDYPQTSTRWKKRSFYTLDQLFRLSREKEKVA